MNVQRALLLLLISSLFQLASAQSVCVDVQASRYAIWQNETFRARIVVNGKEAGDRLQIFLDGESIDLSSPNSADIEASGATLGEKKLKILVKIIRADTPYFMAAKDVVYYVFYPAALFSLEEGNFVYQSIQNPITIYAPGVSPDKIRVSISHAKLNAVGQFKYIIKPDPQYEDIKVNVAVFTGSQTISLGTKTLKILPLPKPVVRAEWSGDTAGKSYISGIHAEIPAGLSFLNPIVRSWDLNVFTKGVWKTYKGSGTDFSAEIVELLKGLQPGDKALLEHVLLTAEGFGEKVEFEGNAVISN